MSAGALDITYGSLGPHWAALATELKGALPSARNLQLSGTAIAGSATAELRAFNGRDAVRERGRASVVPILRGPDGGVRYWVAYLEEWEEISGRKPYRFRAANLTFFHEPTPEVALVQIFRAEWPGVREWKRGELGYQSPGAGHPHWQFDALGHYMSREQRRRRLEAALSLLQQPTNEVEEFGETEPLSLAADTVAEEEVDLSWTAIHFAAGARWPKERWRGDESTLGTHTWVPSELDNIRSWVTSTVLYVREELLKSSRGCQL